MCWPSPWPPLPQCTCCTVCSVASWPGQRVQPRNWPPGSGPACLNFILCINISSWDNLTIKCSKQRIYNKTSSKERRHVVFKEWKQNQTKNSLRRAWPTAWDNRRWSFCPTWVYMYSSGNILRRRHVAFLSKTTNHAVIEVVSGLDQFLPIRSVLPICTAEAIFTNCSRTVHTDIGGHR